MSADGVKVSEIYQCQVCWENMLDRRPRSLKCTHSFCEDCLSRLLKGTSITCPTCRSETLIGQSVSELPIDFKLSKFKDLEKELVLNVETVCQMCFVKGNKVAATVKCVDCNRMMCDACIHIHDKIPVVQCHRKQKLSQILSSDVCNLHGQTVGYLCHHCMKAICLDCMFTTEHMEHNEEIEEFKSGCSKIRIKSEEIINDMVHEKAKIEKRMKQVTLDLAKMKNMEKQLLEEKTKQEAIIQETNEKLNDLKVKYMTGAEKVKQRLDDMHNALTQTCVLLEKIQEKSDEEFITKLGQVLPETQKKLKGSQEVLGEFYRMPTMKQGKFDLQGSKKNMVLLTVEDLLSSKPRFSLFLSSGSEDADVSFNSEDTQESDDSSDEVESKVKPICARTSRAIGNAVVGIIPVDLFTVIIVSFKEGALVRVDRSGNVVTAYYVGGDEEIIGACLEGGKLYTVSKKVDDGNSDPEQTDKSVLYNVTSFPIDSEFVHERQHFHFYVQSDENVPVTPVVVEDGILFQSITRNEVHASVNPQAQFIEDDPDFRYQHVSADHSLNILKWTFPLETPVVFLKNRFTFASIFHTLKASQYYNKKPKICYIITCKEGIVIFDLTGQILKKIKAEDSEHKYGGLFVFDNGDFLVANGNKVCLYDSAGSFVKNVLTQEEHGIEHAAYIEVQGRRLWVLESEALDDYDSWRYDDRFIRCYDYE